MFIGGKWRDAASGATMPVMNPATEEVITAVPSAGQSDVNAAVAAAKAALSGPWGTMSARERGALIWRMGETLVLLCQIDEFPREFASDHF